MRHEPRTLYILHGSIIPDLYTDQIQRQIGEIMDEIIDELDKCTSEDGCDNCSCKG